MRRLEHAVINAVERSGGLLQFAQQELHDLAGMRLHHDEADDPLYCGEKLRARRFRIPGRRNLATAWRLAGAQCLAGNRLDGLDDVVGGGGAEAFLAAEMIGNRAYIGLCLSRDLAGRGAVKTLPAEQFQRRLHECGAGKLRRGLAAWIFRVG